ncbi:hypothetical protein [Kocuria rosea]|nr:hypothetical protein [Kocuria rosea]
MSYHHRRGTGIWTGSLYIGQFASPIVLGVAAASAVGRPQRTVAAD